MARGKRRRHAHRAGWAGRLRTSPTTLALVSLAALFVAAGVLTLHVLSVPSDLRQEHADGPTAVATHQVVATHVRASESRAARSDQRNSPTPTPTPSTHTAAPRTSPAPAAVTSSSRPSPRPSPSSSSSGPLPLPTLTRPPAH